MELDNPITFTFRNDVITFDFPIPNDHIRNKMIKIQNFYEWNLLRTLPKFFKGGTSIDIGAYIGTHTVFFKKYCRFDKVISFEPNPISYKYLIKNCKLNNIEAELINNSVSNINGKCISKSISDTNSGSSIIISDDEGTINIVKLDDYDFKDVKLIKIDTEGMECEVIDGGVDLINMSHPIIIAECFEDKYTDRYEKINTLLESMGYKNIYTIGYNGVWKHVQ